MCSGNQIMNDKSINTNHSTHGSGKCDPVEICISLCRETACLPFYAKPGDAGMDIVAAVDMILAPGETKLVPTGLKVAIPEGYEIQVRPRSGLSLNTPLRIPNAPGTIDSGYRDEICVILSNSSCIYQYGTIISNDPVIIQNDSTKIQTYTVSTKGNKQGNYHIQTGDRIAQIVLQKVPQIIWKETESVTDMGSNRGGGFGSTGHKA